MSVEMLKAAVNGGMFVAFLAISIAVLIYWLGRR